MLLKYEFAMTFSKYPNLARDSNGTVVNSAKQPFLTKPYFKPDGLENSMANSAISLWLPVSRP